MSGDASTRLRALSCSVLLVFSVIAAVTALSGGAAAGNASTLAGSGTAGDPYVITDAGELQAIGQDLDAHYVLGNDIDASATSEWNGGMGFEPIRGSDPENTAGDRFTGTFDGRGHAISNLTIDRTGEKYVGLFGFVGDGTIANVSLVDANVAGAFGGGTSPDIGALAGYSLGTTVSNASVSGAVNGTGATSTVGGLIGWSEETTVVDSSSSANVSAGGSDEVGGLVGYNLGYTDGSSVVNSRASGNVSGGTFVGGLVGYTEAYGGESEISNSTASADVTGVNGVGGLIGFDRGTRVIGSSAVGNVTGDDRVGGLVGHSINVDRIERSYAAGNVSAATNGGGLVGQNDGTILSSYWNVDRATTGVGGGTTSGATALTTAELTGESAADNMPEFDFGANWTTTDTYPRQYWTATGLTITPGETELTPGTTTNATTSLQLVGGTNVSATTVATYSSSDTSVATVGDGSVTAGAPGQTTITVEHAGETDSVVLSVVDTTVPSADAGSDRTVDEDTQFTLDASNSTDNVGVASYAWDLGDGNATAGPTPTHTYDDPGTYTVTLTVTDGAGNVATDTVTVTVADTTAPAAEAGDNSTTEVGTAITLNGSESTDNVGVTAYEWDLYDNGTVDATGETVTHAYADPGNYTVTLSVADAAGNVDVDTTWIEVESGGEGDDSGGGDGDPGGGDGDSGSNSAGGDDSTEPAGETGDGADESITEVSADPNADGGATAAASVDGGDTILIDLGEAVRDEDAGTILSSAEITLDGEAEGGTLTLEARSLAATSGSPDVPQVGGDAGDSDAGSDVLAYFELDATVDGEDASDRIESATVRFTVAEGRLAGRGTDGDDLALYRFDEGSGSWEELDTGFVGERDGRLVHEATTSEFSLFAVVGPSAAEPEAGTTTATPTSTDVATSTETASSREDATAARSTEAESPGFGVLLAVVSFLLVVALARRSRG